MGSYPIPFGLLRVSRNDQPLPPMTFEDNVLRDNQEHLAVFELDDSIVRNNTFERLVPLIEDPVPGIILAAAGLWFSGTDVQVIGNQFRGNQFPDPEQGIRLAGNDVVGTAIDAILVDNRFCEVATNIVAEAGATYTEQGTLICPFPDPVLKILSWPGIEEGFSVQSAATLGGPWNTLNAIPTRQDGKNTLAVPAASDQPFFRLVKEP